MGVIMKQTIKGTLANYLGVLIGMVTTFVVVTKLLTQEEVGLTRVMVDAAMLFATLAQLGTTSSIQRFYPHFHDDAERDHGFFGWSLLLPLIGFTLIAAVFFLFKGSILARYAVNAPMIVDYAYLLLPLTFFVLYMSVFETNASVLLHIAMPKFVREVVVRLLNLGSYLLYGFDILSLDTFIIVFCCSYAVATVINFCYLLSLRRISFRLDWQFVDKRLLVEVTRYTLVMTAVTLTSNVKLFNSLFLATEGLKLAGIYTIASYIAAVIEIPYRSLGAIATPVISTAVQKDDWKEVNRLGRQVTLHQLLGASLILFFIWINLQPLFAIIPNGDSYASGSSVVLILGIAILINSTFGIAVSILNLSRKYRYALLFVLLLTGTVIACNIWLIPLWGINGSACATLFGYIIYYTPLLFLLRHSLGVTLLSRKQITVVLMVLGFFLLNHIWSLTLSPLFSQMGQGIVAILVQAAARTGCFALLTLLLLRRLHISPDIDKMLKLPFRHLS